MLTWLRTTPRKTYRQGVAGADELAGGFPASLEELYGYGLVILGSLPASTLDDEQHASLESFVAERGGSVLVLAGREALDDGGWDVKPLARALPVVLERAPEDAPPGYTAGEYAAHPTSAGLSSPLADLGGSSELEREERWATLPMLGDYQRLGSLKAGATTLLEAQGSVRVVPGAEPTVIVPRWCRRAAPGRATLRLRTSGRTRDGLDVALANAHCARGRPPRAVLATPDPAPGRRGSRHAAAER